MRRREQDRGLLGMNARYARLCSLPSRIILADD